MKIRELISQLNVQYMLHGDIDVFVNNYEILCVGYDDDAVNIEG